MTRDRKVIIALGIGFTIYVTLVCIAPAVQFLPSTVRMVSTNQDAYETRVAYSDYKSYTTPLSKDVVEDICAKFEIQGSSEDCAADAVVYAPELFAEIQEYFSNRIARERTYEFMEEKLGAYWVNCEVPMPSKSYVCNYDLRGDGKYLIRIAFDKYNRYFPPYLRIDGS